jgi:hypothetical protein
MMHTLNPKFERVGRAMLGQGIWLLLADWQQPMTFHLRHAWAQAVRRDPQRAIEDYAESRGVPVDGAAVLNSIRGARLLGEDSNPN